MNAIEKNIKSPLPYYHPFLLKVMARLALILLQMPSHAFANQDSIKKMTYGAYGEVYYSYDFAKPPNHEKESFIYNHKRHNEININLLLLNANYTEKHIHANLGIMAGNYAHYNLSNEPIWAQFIYEANAGIRLSSKYLLWLDAGIMPSHIGFESAISANCYTLTRSILAENSPYFESGIKLSYSSNNQKLNAAFLLVNGWQNIQKQTNMQLPSCGVQVSYKIYPSLLFNYSNFIGTAKPDTLQALRLYHNFYFVFEPAGKLALIGGFDFSTDKFTATKYGNCYAPVLIAKFKCSSKIALATRAEYYNDKHQIIISSMAKNGFSLLGLSCNLDYQINEKIVCRLEPKVYSAAEKIFQHYKSTNYSITTNMTIKL